MRSAQVTIKDIARELGISPSTVSKALKDHPDISKDTKMAVRKLAAKFNYKPNALALSLRNSKSNTIGLIIPEVVHFFFSTVVSGIEDVAYDAGYNVMMCQSNESYFREVKNAQALLSSRIEGLLVSVSKDTKDFSHFYNFKKNNIPIVFFDRICEEMETDRVIVDDFKGAYDAVNHLISIGCKRIAHFGTTSDLLIGKYRREGYIQALKDNNLPVDENLILECDSYKAARLITKRLIYERQPPDGIFSVNDLTAIGALQTIKENGFNIPEDFKIAGFGNGNYTTMTDPPLTTVEQYGYKIGEKAATLLLDRLLRGDDYPSITEKIDPQLIIRKSTILRKEYWTG